MFKVQPNSYRISFPPMEPWVNQGRVTSHVDIGQFFNKALRGALKNVSVRWCRREDAIYVNFLTKKALTYALLNTAFKNESWIYD